MSDKKKYLDWASAGGPNECKHGYAAGIPCPDCDAAESLPAESDKECENCKRGTCIKLSKQVAEPKPTPSTRSHSVQVTYEGRVARAECICGWGVRQDTQVSASGFVQALSAEHLAMHQPDSSSISTFEEWWVRHVKDYYYAPSVEEKGLAHAAWAAAKGSGRVHEGRVL
jgi:hypothetical protein